LRQRHRGKGIEEILEAKALRQGYWCKDIEEKWMRQKYQGADIEAEALRLLQSNRKSWKRWQNYMNYKRLMLLLKPFQNKKRQKNLRYPTKKQSFSKEKDCFFVGYLKFFGPTYFEVALLGCESSYTQKSQELSESFQAFSFNFLN
jgi:hypothetical protein